VISDRYEVLERLGAGGMGAVYKARDRQFVRIVAVKTLQVLDDRLQALLLREARLLNSLVHDGFVRQYDVVVQRDQIFLVQEFIDGPSLAEWQRSQPLPTVLDIYGRIASALDFLHSRGIVHRDLKPTNVLMERRTGRPVIMDFGLAVRRSEYDDLTRTASTVVGSPGYLSPEVLSGRDVDVGVDIFALGVMLAEAIGGGMPWGVGSVQEQLLRVIREPRAETLGRLPAVAKAGIDTLVSRMLSLEPEGRPTAREVAEELRKRVDLFDPLEDVAGASMAAVIPRDAAVRPVAIASPPPLAASLGSSTTVIFDVPPLDAPRARSTTVILDAPRPAALANLVTPTLLLAGGLILLLGAGVVVVAPRVGWMTLSWLFVAIAGASLTTLALRKRQASSESSGASQAVLDRISAIEAQVNRNGEMTHSMAVAIDDLSARITTDRLQEIVRQSVLITLENLKPATDGPDVDRAYGVVAALRKRRDTPPSVIDRMKEYGGLIGGGLTATAGLVGLLSSTDLWRPNRAPDIGSIGPVTARLQRAAPFALSVEASDPDGDDLTFAWSASAGRIDAKGAGALWTATPGLSDRLVTVTVTANDGHNTVTRTRTLQVNAPPSGTLRADGPVRRGTPLRLAADATDPDGDPLTYQWTMSAGTLANDIGQVVIWRPPNSPGAVEAICTVSDGFEKVSLPLSLMVH